MEIRATMVTRQEHRHPLLAQHSDIYNVCIPASLECQQYTAFTFVLKCCMLQCRALQMCGHCHFLSLRMSCCTSIQAGRNIRRQVVCLPGGEERVVRVRISTVS